MRRGSWTAAILSGLIVALAARALAAPAITIDSARFGNVFGAMAVAARTPVRA